MGLNDSLKPNQLSKLINLIVNQSSVNIYTAFLQTSLNSLLVDWLISILEIIFLHYVAKSFCETIKLPKEMPKVAKCLKCLKLRFASGGSILFKRKVDYFFPILILVLHTEITR